MKDTPANATERTDVIGSSRLLVVDDDENLLRVVSRELRNKGYVCETVLDGPPALEVLGKRTFDVVLVDLEMPQMDGFQVLAAMQCEHPDVIPIVLTGSGDIARAVKAMKLGAFDFLEKPCNPHLLETVIGRALEYRRARKHAQRMESMSGQWQAMFDSSPDVLVATDLEGAIDRCNRAAAAHAGTIPDCLTGKDCHDALCGGAHTSEDCPFRRESDLAVEYELWDGHFEIRPSRLSDNAGNPSGWLFVARDVTLRKKAEAALRASEEKFRQMVNNMALGVLMVDTGMHILETNHRMRKWWPEIGQITESNRPQCYTMFPALRGDAPCKGCPVAAALLDGQVHEDMVTIAREDGPHIFRIMASPIHDCSGKITSAIATYGDITEKLRLARELTMAQKLESVGRLAAGIAHEINTPTQYVGDNLEFLGAARASVLNLIEVFRRLVDTPDAALSAPEVLAEARNALEDANVEYLASEIPRAIEQSLEGVERISSIVQAMKEFSHPGTAEKTFVDLNQCIRSTVTVSRNEWKYVADLDTDLDGGLPPVCCLSGELNQVFLNLIVNAAHAIGDVVGDGGEGKGKIVVSTRCDGDYVEVRIVDTGSGIPKEISEHIFDPFFTTKGVGRGTGQGLAIARNVVVDKHGGTLTFESKMGTGTTFIIRLPIQAGEQTA